MVSLYVFNSIRLITILIKNACLHVKCMILVSFNLILHVCNTAKYRYVIKNGLMMVLSRDIGSEN